MWETAAGLWSEINKNIFENLSFRTLAPALAFWGGGLLIWGITNGWEAFTQLSESETELFSLILIAIFLLTASIYLMGVITFYLLRFAEGYYWPKSLRNWRCKRLKDKLDNKEDRWRKLVEILRQTELEPHERTKYACELAQLDAELLTYPINHESVLPTRLGNILRAAEEYPYINYGLEISIVFPRLRLVLPESFQKELMDSRQQLNQRMQLIAWGLLFFEWSVCSWHAIPIAVSVVLITYPRLLTSAVSYGDLLRSAFDLYRFDLYDALHWSQPDSPATEYEHGLEFTEYLLRHLASSNIRFTPSDIKKFKQIDIERFKQERFAYLIETGNAAYDYLFNSHDVLYSPSEFNEKINELEFRQRVQRFIPKAIKDLEELSHDNDLVGIVCKNLKPEGDLDSLLNKFRDKEENLMFKAEIRPRKRAKFIGDELEKIIKTLNRIHAETEPISAFLSWTEPEDLKSRRHRDIELRRKLTEVKAHLIAAREVLNNIPVKEKLPKEKSEYIRSLALSNFHLFSSGVSLIFINYSIHIKGILAHSPEFCLGFSQLSILLGCLMAIGFPFSSLLEEILAGIKLDLELKFDNEGLQFLSEIRENDNVEVLREIRELIRKVNSVDELRQIYSQRVAES